MFLHLSVSTLNANMQFLCLWLRWLFLIYALSEKSMLTFGSYCFLLLPLPMMPFLCLGHDGVKPRRCWCHSYHLLRGAIFSFYSPPSILHLPCWKLPPSAFSSVHLPSRGQSCQASFVPALPTLLSGILSNLISAFALCDSSLKFRAILLFVVVLIIFNSVFRSLFLFLLF